MVEYTVMKHPVAPVNLHVYRLTYASSHTTRYSHLSLRLTPLELVYNFVSQQSPTLWI